MYCSKCGKLLNEDDIFCSKCGELINKTSDNLSSNNEIGKKEENMYPTFNSNHNNNSYTYVKEKKEKTNPILVIISFLLPIVGLILFIVNKNDNKKRSNSCGVAALVGLIVYLILLIVGVVMFLHSLYNRSDFFDDKYFYNNENQDINNFDFFNDEFNNDFFNEFDTFFNNNELDNNSGSGNI